MVQSFVKPLPLGDMVVNSHIDLFLGSPACARSRSVGGLNDTNLFQMGVNRDLKKANELYWGSKLSQSDLLAEGKRLRLSHWKLQQKAGIDLIPSNDFSFYGSYPNSWQLDPS